MRNRLKNHTMGFELWGLVLFAVIMLPNIYWMTNPAPNDLLRIQSITHIVDGIASVCQMAMVFCLCFIRNTDAASLRLSPLMTGVVVCTIGYLAAWMLYYIGVMNVCILLALTLLPCAAFVLFLLDRRNRIGLIPAGVFTLCHVIFAAANFLMVR